MLDRLNQTIDEAEQRKLSPEQKAERDRQKAAKQKREQQAKMESHWKQLLSTVGKRYTTSTLEGYVCKSEAQTNAVNELKTYCSTPEIQLQEGSGILLFGPAGTGKDHLAVAVMRRLIGAGYDCMAVDGQALFQKSRDIIGTDEQEDEFLKPYIKATFLLISDPVPPLEGSESPKQYQLSVLWRIIDARYREMLPTIITINVADRTELDRRMSPQIADRVAHGSLVIPCNWESYRSRKGAQ